MFRHILLYRVCLSVMAVVFTNCAGPNTERMADVNPLLWSEGTPAVIDIENTDTCALYRLDILLVFNEAFDRRPVDLAVAVTAPDSTHLAERTTIPFFDLAHKRGDYYHSIHPYRDSVRLIRPGSYFFAISPERDMVGVRAVGINITKI